MNQIVSETEYWAALYGVEGLGPLRFDLLVKYFGSAQKAWHASETDLIQVGLGKNVIKALKTRRQLNFQSYQKTLAKQGIQVIITEDNSYPKRLLEIVSAPKVLYIKGSIKSQDHQAIAVVGTRRPTAYGRQVADKLATQLVNSGFTIISGLARGIDTVAHRAALKAGGRTIAILGTAINRVYPPENRELATLIAQSGAVISEYGPNAITAPASFKARNRIISGMSSGVLIIEGASKSGTKITARHALDQGREVFAVPGPITSEMSDAPADLIKLGAKPVTSINDILEEFPHKVSP